MTRGWRLFTELRHTRATQPARRIFVPNFTVLEVGTPEQVQTKKPLSNGWDKVVKQLSTGFDLAHGIETAAKVTVAWYRDSNTTQIPRTPEMGDNPCCRCSTRIRNIPAVPKDSSCVDNNGGAHTISPLVSILATPMRMEE